MVALSLNPNIDRIPNVTTVRDRNFKVATKVKSRRADAPYIRGRDTRDALTQKETHTNTHTPWEVTRPLYLVSILYSGL